MMKTSVALLAIAAGLSGLAAAAPGPGPDTQGPPQIPFPLKGPIKIDPSALVMIPPEPPPTHLEQALTALSNLRRDLEEFKRVRTAYKTALDGCASKSYTVQEMQAAGCAGNDTLAACSRKLLHACITTARRPAEKYRDSALNDLQNVQRAVHNAVFLPDSPKP